MTAASSTAALAEVVVTLGGTTLDVRHVGPGDGPAWSTWAPRFTVGEGPGVHLPAAIAGQDARGVVDLVEAAGAGIRVRLVAGVTGTIERDGESCTVAARIGRGESVAVLRAGDAASLLIGPALVTIRVQACTPVEKFRAVIDRPLWIGQGGALALLAVLMVVVQTTTPREAPRFEDPDVQASLIRYLKPTAEAVQAPVVDAVRASAQARPVATATATNRPAVVVEDAAAPVGAMQAIAQGLRGQGATAVAKQSGIFAIADFMKGLEKAADEARVARAKYVAMGADDSAFAAAADRAAPTVLTGLGLANTGRHGGGLAAGVIDFDWAWLVPKGGLRSLDSKKLRARAGREKFAEREVSREAAPERRQSVVWTASVGRDLIRGVVNRNKPDVRQCFRDGAIGNPGLAGEIEVAFTIQSDGAVGYASVASSTLGDEAVEACVTASVKRWKFPLFVASGGDVDVRFPFAVGKA